MESMIERLISMVLFYRASHHNLKHRILWGAVYLFVFTSGLSAFVCLVVYYVNRYADSLLVQKQWDDSNFTVVGCSKVDWIVVLLVFVIVSQRLVQSRSETKI